VMNGFTVGCHCHCVPVSPCHRVTVSLYAVQAGPRGDQLPRGDARRLRLRHAQRRQHLGRAPRGGGTQQGHRGAADRRAPARPPPLPVGSSEVSCRCTVPLPRKLHCYTQSLREGTMHVPPGLGLAALTSTVLFPLLLHNMQYNIQYAENFTVYSVQYCSRVLYV